MSTHHLVEPTSTAGSQVWNAHQTPTLSWARAASWEWLALRAVVVLDAVAAAAAGVVTLLLLGTAPSTPANALGALVVAPAAWVGGLYMTGAYHPRVAWGDVEVLRRILTCALILLAVVATLSWSVGSTAGRQVVLTAAPLVVALSLGHRVVARSSLRRRRSRGECRRRVVIVGGPEDAERLTRQITGMADGDLEVAAACLPSGAQEPALQAFGIPVLGDYGSVVRAVNLVNADMVMVAASADIDSAALRRISWALEGTEAELVVAPTVTEVVGSRMAIRTMSGLSVLHVERPELRGPRRSFKGLLDRLVALLAVALLLPIFAVVCSLIRIESRGPVFFRQRRVGRNGREFVMWKFRTMTSDAEDQRVHLTLVNDAAGLLFKIRDDPRVTRIGRVLRRYSLDELPQLFNVLAGHMSLVGPRPALPEEVQNYDIDLHRRLAVKPGMTGLWQVSGRSDLAWDQAVTLDLRYVDNWSISLDALIVWKTFGAVLHGRGAY